MALGIWSVSGTLAWLLSFLLPLRGIIFRGDSGVVLLWVWLGVPHVLAAVLAAIALVWVTDTRKPLSWLFGLAALLLYSESMHAWRNFRRIHEPRSTADHIGITIAAAIPVLTCLAIGVWWKKRLDGNNFPNG